jgi:Kef-type K+ transport system membrane component KefB/Trk K+ transport system NAD-binding subunit
MEHHSMTSLMLVVGIAFLIPILLLRFNLKVIPVVVAEIIAGIIIGKSGFNIIKSDPYLELLSLLGFIFLMFLSGLEIDFSSFTQKKERREKKENEINPLKVSLFVFLGILGISFLLSYILTALGFISDPYFMTLIISTISLGVVVPVLKEKKLMKTKYGQTILLIAVISDFVTIVLLAVYVATLSDDATNALWLLVLFGLVFVSYFLIRFFYKGKLYKPLKEGTVQLGTRAVFALILLFVALSETLGAENILGAFLAGVIVSLLSPKREFVHQLDSFGYGFLIPIFFVMVGVNLDIWSLFSNPKILLFIPLLLFALFISKMVPLLFLRKWFSWKEVFAGGVILTSTLSLVIAASTIALQLGIINETLNSSFIIVAILSCFIFPVIFSKMIPKVTSEKETVSIIGSNGITLPISLDLQRDGYDVKLYGSKPSKEDAGEESVNKNYFSIQEVPALEINDLQEHHAFESSVIVLGTSYDQLNIEFAKHAKSLGIERIIIRVENIELHEELRNEGFLIFSTIYATRTLLKALVESPSAVQLMTQNDESIQEIEIQNPHYNNVLLRNLPFLGRALILRIYRGDNYLIPHGDTSLEVGDRILVSGSVEHIRAMKVELT